jgi:PAS domain S-box-containing protein
MDSLFSSIISCRELEYIILDLNLQILESSSQVERFSEFPEELETGHDIRMAFPELCGMEEVIDAIGQGNGQNFKLKSLAKTNPRSSSVFYVDLYIGSIPGGTEGERNIIILLEDTSEQAIVEQKLIQRVNEAILLKTAWSDSQVYLNKIINSMAESLLITNWQGIIKKINPAARAMFGYEESELLDRSICILIAPSNQMSVSNLDFGLKKASILMNSEVQCITKSGQKIVVSFSLSRIHTTLSEMPDLVYLGKDITQRVLTETKLRQALEKEKEINEFCKKIVNEIQLGLRDSQRLKFFEEDKIEARFDTTILKYIFTNTIHSITKYSSSNLEIYIRLERSREEIFFEVIDSSSYLREEDRDNISIANKSSNISGMSLELALVKKYVEIHGGRIEIESEIEFGTVFRVILPLQSCTIDDR